MMLHSEMDGLYELYVLGALEFEAATEIDSHLANDCQQCREHVNRAVYTTAALSYLAEERAAPASVRERLLASVNPIPLIRSAAARRRRWTWALPALAAACLLLLIGGFLLNNRLSSTHQQLSKTAGERDELRRALELLTRTETRAVQYGQENAVPHGRVLVNPSGKVVVVGSEMPPLAAGKTFELWLVPKQGNPIPAGLFHANAQGSFVHLTEMTVDPSRVAAVAVSVEPEGGSTAPTTKPFLIVPLG